MKSKYRKQIPAWQPSVIVLHEHHAARYIDASTEAIFERSALKILRARVQSSEFLFSDKEMLQAKNAISKKDADSAWEILKSRNDNEDERVELCSVETSYESNEDENSV